MPAKQHSKGLALQSKGNFEPVTPGEIRARAYSHAAVHRASSSGELSKAAGLHRNAIAYWERHATIPAGGFREPVACRHIRQALQAAGVEVFTNPAPGVRFVSGRQ